MYRDYVFLFSASMYALIDRQWNSRSTWANGFVHGVIAIILAGYRPSWITLVIEANGPLRSIDASVHPASSHRAGNNEVIKYFNTPTHPDALIEMNDMELAVLRGVPSHSRDRLTSILEIYSIVWE